MKNILTICPSCSLKRLELTLGPLEIKVGNKSFQIPDIEHYTCVGCGEVLTGVEAEQKIDAFLSKKRKKAA